MHVTLAPGSRQPRQPKCEDSGWKVQVHYRHLKSSEILTAKQARVTSPSRTLLDLAPAYGFTDLVCLFDAALREGWLDLEGLHSVVHRGRGKGYATACLAVHHARVGAQSPLETKWRLLLERAGLAPDVLQYEYTIGSRHYFADMAWIGPHGILLLECDGVGVHSTVEAVLRDRTRQNDLVLAGFHLLRVTASDLHDPQRALNAIREGLALIYGQAVA